MAEQTSGTIDIDASPEDVLDVIMDFAAYPKWAQGVRKATVQDTDSKGRPSEVVIETSMMGVSSKQTMKYSYKAKNAGVSWKSTRSEGAAKSVSGSYELTPKDERTHVTYEMTMELAIPLPSMLKRRGERIIIDSALKGLKKEVERRA